MKFDKVCTEKPFYFSINDTALASDNLLHFWCVFFQKEYQK